YGTPLTLARICDVKNKHWLATFVLDPRSAKYASSIDTSFGDFVTHVHESLLPNGGFKGGIDSLFIEWSMYFWSTQINQLLSWASSATSDKNLKLIQLSALHKFRDSVAVNYDILTVFEQAVKSIPIDSDICTYLPDIFEVSDESKIPYFRDWLLNFASRNNLSDSTPINRAPLPKPESAWSAEWLVPLTKSSLYQSLPNPLKEVTNTSLMMDKYIATISSSQWRDLNELATDVSHQIDELRNETPKVWSKENKKLITSLKTQKQQLLTSVLRDLRASGLKPAVNKSTVKSQTELTKVLAELPIFPNFDSVDSGESYLYAMIDLLPRIRSAVSESVHEQRYDVPLSDIQRGLAFGENMLAAILKLRKSIAKNFVEFNFDENCQTLLFSCISKPSAVYDQKLTKLVSENVGNTTLITLDVVKQVLSESDSAEPSSLRSLQST
ncbi:hypothetical protein FF38_07697, partial [Lucilia cuprina]